MPAVTKANSKQRLQEQRVLLRRTQQIPTFTLLLLLFLTAVKLSELQILAYKTRSETQLPSKLITATAAYREDF